MFQPLEHCDIAAVMSYSDQSWSFDLQLETSQN